MQSRFKDMTLGDLVMLRHKTREKTKGLKEEREVLTDAINRSERLIRDINSKIQELRHE